MKKIFILLFWLILIFEQTFSVAHQSKITFEHIKSLPPAILCLFQDQTGYLWFGTYWGIHRYDGYSFKSYIPNDGDSTYLSNQVVVTDLPSSVIQAICGDKEGNIWAGHEHGLEKLDAATGKVTHYRLNPNAPLTDWSNHVLALLEDRDDNLWIGTGGGLYLFDKTTETFKWMKHDSTDPGSIISNAVNAIYETKDGTIWLGIGNGLDKYDKSTNKFTHYWVGSQRTGIIPGNPHWILSIYEDREGIMWLGTTGGLVEYDRKFGIFSLFTNNPNDPQSLKNNIVKSISEDLDGNLWISTIGIDIFNKHTQKFTHHNHDQNDHGSISTDNVGNILFEKSGTIWITSYGGGLNKVTPGKRYEREYSLTKYGNVPTDWNLAEDRNGEIWIGTEKGLLSFDPVNEIFKVEQLKIYIAGLIVDKAGTLWISDGSSPNLYFKKANDKKIIHYEYPGKDLFPEGVQYMCNSNDGNIWLASGGNILKLFPDRKVAEQILKVENWITYLFEDKTGLLWIGTDGGGLTCYKPDKKTATKFIYDPKDSLTISGNSIVDLCEDGEGALWVTANTRLNKFDRQSQKFIRWGSRDGLPIDDWCLSTDVQGNLWISNGNLIKYDPRSKQHTVYYDYKIGVGYKTKIGELYYITVPYFGESQSLYRFNPDSLRNNQFVAPIVITDFRKFEKSFPIGKEIHLPYSENYLSFEFAALNFIHPEKNQYAYKMEGVDKDWIYSGSRRYASYPNLDPGEYIFRVKGSNNEGIWNEEGTSLAIIISPPWWKTLWAYSTYAAIFIFVLYGIRRYEMNRLRLKDKVKLDEAVLQEREETDKIKSRFFANISHEFRTPLTLILGPAEKIEKNQSANPIKDAGIITRNSKRLLQLVNQLLDLSKLDSGKLKLKTSPGNIISFIKGAALSFESLSESRDIIIKIKSDKEFIEVYFDKEKMVKVFSNLLSNAFKFTPVRGNVTINIAETLNNTVEIKIRNTGVGIPKQELSKLFDRFYQVDSSQTKEHEGTGIGLALVKELIELHRGKIEVDSEMGISEKAGSGWTEFTITLPLGRMHLKADEIISRESGVIEKEITLDEVENISPMNQLETESNQDESKTTILVVEDNYDMRGYIKESLSDNYSIEEAVNGEQGVRIAENIIPDLIISDLMMPKMDGNELTRILKNDERTSHIPIILLTAKSGQENKIEGLQTGADDYLTKPFDLQELRIRVVNLISIRKKLQEKFSKGEFLLKRSDKKIKSIDEKFLTKVLQVIEKHLSEEDFSIEDCSNEVGFSRTHFHKKLRALVGKSPSQYVRTVRLYKAKKMIEEEKGNISEVAYSVGFSSPAYFSKCFKEEFGYSPSDILNG